MVIATFALIGQRFFLGLGAVTNLNDGFPWGIWIVYDVVIGTAFACGGYVLAFLVYVFNKGQYHPLVRTALLASLFGYALGGVSAFLDMGRYFNMFNFFDPGSWNWNSTMLEVALCVMAYTMVLIIEFLPPVFERFGWLKLKAKLEKVLFVFIAIGALLPTMHQSSLGSLLIAMGPKVYPLWQVNWMQPLFAIITAVLMGLTIIVWEGSIVSVGFSRKPETHLLTNIGKFAFWTICLFLVLRLADLTVRGVWPLAFAGDRRGNFFLLEMVLYFVPLVILASPTRRQRGSQLLIAATTLLLAGGLYRLNAMLIGWVPDPSNPTQMITYFPSFTELFITIGLIATEVFGFIVAVKLFPVLPNLEAETT